MTSFPLFLITQETIEGLKNTHKHVMQVNKPGMETYSILFHELVPILESSPLLKTEFDRRRAIKPVKGVFIDESILNLSSEFQFLFDLLYVRDHRMEYLGNREKLFEAQQILDLVFKELLHFAEKNKSNSKIVELHKKGPGRRPQANFIQGHINIGDATCKIRSSIRITPFCDLLFNKTKVNHSLSWQDIHEAVYHTHHQYQEHNWHDIDALVRRVNDATKKKGFGELLKYEGGKEGKVTRLG